MKNSTQSYLSSNGTRYCRRDLIHNTINQVIVSQGVVTLVNYDFSTTGKKRNVLCTKCTNVLCYNLCFVTICIVKGAI